MASVALAHNLWCQRETRIQALFLRMTDRKLHLSVIDSCEEQCSWVPVTGSSRDQKQSCVETMFVSSKRNIGLRRT